MKPGSILAGKYRVDRVLGSGGMGVVVAARNLALDQRVALKFMLRDSLDDADSVARFLREARAVARLRSEHVARVYDVGTLDDGSPYIVMELLDGRDLAALLEARGALPVAEASHLVMQACLAMTEAHRHGIVHRDLKPKNLFLAKRPDGLPGLKVLDFGVSKVPQKLAGARAAHTHSSVIMGSPAYMSPEQMRSAKNVDVRTDVWALGVILFQLVSGELPFEFESLAVLCAKVLNDAHRPLASLVPDVPPEFAALVDRCLAKDPVERFPDMVELAEALSPFSGAAGPGLVDSIRRLAAREVTVDEPHLEDIVDSHASTIDVTPREEVNTEVAVPLRMPRRSRLGVRLAAGAVTLAAIAGAVGIWVATRPPVIAKVVAPEPRTSKPPEPEVTPLPVVTVSVPAPVMPPPTSAPATSETVSAAKRPPGRTTRPATTLASAPAPPPVPVAPPAPPSQAPAGADVPDAGDPFRSGPQ